MTDPISNERRKVWPLGGYAPGGYSCTCVDCGDQFVGDKRSNQCLDCAIVWANKTITELQSRRQSPAGVEIKPSAILSQIALWSDDEGLELSMGQGNDLVRRIMSVVRAAGISEQMLIDAFIRGESWRKRNDVDRYVAVPEMVNKAARDYADAALSSEPHNGREVE